MQVGVYHEELKQCTKGILQVRNGHAAALAGV